MMCDKEALVGYLYDELDEGDRVLFERHLAGCVECRDEVEGLRATRAHLAKWAPPEPEFALPRFRIVRDDQPTAVAARRFRVSPAWGLAAAAVLLLAVASAVANLEIRYGSEGLLVRTGWSRAAALPSAPATSQAGAVPASAAWMPDVRSLDQRVRRLEEAVPAHQHPTTQPAAAPARISDAELLRQVRAIVSESETRQQRDVALRLTQLVREWDAQRQTDLVRVQQGLQRLQGLTDAQLIQHRDALNNLYVRVSQQPK
jgi:hypothetical protein